ncbi:formate dehydrogenase accessory protein FdhE [Chloroflexota bacterium]
MPTKKGKNTNEKLGELESTEGILPQLLEFYNKLSQVQSKTEQQIGKQKPGLTNKAIAKRIENGIPLVGFAELDLNWPLFNATFTKVTAAFAQYPDLFGRTAENIKGLDFSRFLTKAKVKAWFEKKRLPPIDDADKGLFENILHATLKPFLTSHRKALLGPVDQDKWRRGYCPICGGSPDFAFLDKERGARWLICSRCDAEWLFQRLECPYCGNKDQSALAYFTDDKGLYRLYVCEQCKRYLKAIDLRQSKPEVVIPRERLSTLSIDMQAQEYGYSPWDKATSDQK